MVRPEFVRPEWAEEAEAALTSDPLMGPLVKSQEPIKLENWPDPFQKMVSTVVHQQLSGKAAKTILGRVHDRYGGRCPTPEEILETPVEDLREDGLSRPKAGYLHSLAETVQTGELDCDNLRDLTDEEIIKKITAIKGFGVWSAQMILMFALHRPNIYPLDDLGIRNGLARVLGGDPTMDEMKAAGEAWQPWRSLATWHLWRVLEA